MSPAKKFIFILTFLSSMNVHAFTIAGFGATSCGEYLQGRSFSNSQMNDNFSSWLQGYLSGVNISRQDRKYVNLPDAPSILAYMDKYCRDNPLKIVLEGANTLYRDLK